MTFRLFGFDVEVQYGFWLTAGLLGLPILQSGLHPLAILIWMAVVFASVLVHELGHALAIRRHRIEPVIALHWMGGTTSWRMVAPIGRGARIIISLAGPFAGFAFAFALWLFAKVWPGGIGALPQLGQFAYDQLMWVNIVWGVVNLLPVLPFDGGHVLEHAMGPTRTRATAAISFAVGVLVALFFLAAQAYLAAMLFGFGAMQSYQRFRGESPTPERSPSMPPPDAEPIPGVTQVLIARARDALAVEDTAKAVSLAEQILAGVDDEDHHEPPHPVATRMALEIIAWAHLIHGRVDDAVKVHSAIAKLGEPDLALTGAIHFHKGNMTAARRVLESARMHGDDRKEVVGPLIQILIADGDVPRAAAVAYDIVDSLSTEDARRVAQIAFEAGAFEWSARLSEAMFERERTPEDAYEAARAHAKDGARDRALELLKSAVDAGFSDRARAWSDAALEVLRVESREFEAVVPRP